MLKKLILFSLFSTLLLGQKALGTAKVSAFGSISRGATVMSVTVSIDGASPERGALDGDNLDKVVQTSLNLYITNSDSQEAMRYPAESEGDGTFNPEFKIISFNISKEEKEDGFFIFTVNLSIVSIPETEITSFITSKGNIDVKVGYEESDDSDEEVEGNTTVEMDKFVANEAPNLSGIIPGNQSLAVEWAEKTEISYNNDSKKAPTAITVFAIKLDQPETRELEATVYKENLQDEVANDGSCTFEYSIDAGEEKCSVEACTSDLNLEDAAYINITGTESIKVSTTTYSPNNANTTELRGLENDKKYAVFAQYQPSGLQLSSCIIGTPVRDYSLTELNGADNAKPGNPKCFIATAAYGSPIHSAIYRLRNFRDKVLLKNKVGIFLVSKYYDYSPKVAAKIRDSELLKKITRAALTPIIAWLFLIQELPFLAVCLSLLGLAAIAAKTSIIARRGQPRT